MSSTAYKLPTPRLPIPIRCAFNVDDVMPAQLGGSVRGGAFRLSRSALRSFSIVLVVLRLSFDDLGDGICASSRPSCRLCRSRDGLPLGDGASTS